MPRRRTRPRYRTIETTLCGDAAFLSLSDDGKLLYFVIRTGPHTTSIPGLWPVSEDTVTRLLSWTRRRVTAAMVEIQAAGLLKHDEKAGVVFLPAVLLADPPPSPDAVRGWKDAWVELPQSPLKAAAAQMFEQHCARRDGASPGRFSQALAEVLIGYTAHTAGHGVPDGASEHVPRGVGHQESGDQEHESGARKPPVPRWRRPSTGRTGPAPAGKYTQVMRGANA